MVWDGICHDGRTQLTICQGTLNGVKYRRYSRSYRSVLSASAKLWSRLSRWQFKLSRDSCLSRLSEPESHPCSSLLVLSPDLSPIEQLWDELGRGVRHRHNPPETIQELHDTHVHERNNIPQTFIQRLIGYMRLRCEAVVASRGGHTRYITPQTSILHDNFCLSMICSDNDVEKLCPYASKLYDFCRFCFRYVKHIEDKTLVLFLLLTSIYKSHHLYIMWSLFRIVYIWWFRKHFPVLSSFMTYRGVCDQIITTGTISGAGMAYPSGPPEFTPIFSGVRVTRSLALCVYFVDHFLSFYTFSVGHCVVCPSSIYGFWLPPCYLLAIVLSVLLRFTDYYYPFGICWPLCCLFFFDLRILITPLISVGHCVVCSSSIYGFLLPLWYLLAIVLSVLLRFTDSYYPFDIFKLFLLRLLMTIFSVVIISI